MASRSLSDLHPVMQTKAAVFVAKAKDRGVDVLIYCTFRSGTEQDALYAMGRTTKSNVGVTPLRRLGKIVTNARAGQSAHNFTINGKPAAKAWDCVPLDHGSPAWSESHPSWKILGEIAAEMGLNWYGRKGAPFHELCHFQMVD